MTDEGTATDRVSSHNTSGDSINIDFVVSRRSELVGAWWDFSNLVVHITVRGLEVPALAHRPIESYNKTRKQREKGAYKHRIKSRNLRTQNPSNEARLIEKKSSKLRGNRRVASPGHTGEQ